MSELDSELVFLLRGDGCNVAERHHEHLREVVDSIINKISEGEGCDIIIVLVVQDDSPPFRLTPACPQLSINEQNGQVRSIRVLWEELMVFSTCLKETVFSFRAFAACWTATVTC